MKRTSKNIVTLVLIAILIFCTYLTMNHIKSNVSSNQSDMRAMNVPQMPDNSNMQAPPDMQNTQGESADTTDTSSRPKMPNNQNMNNGGTPPAKPDNENMGDSNNSSFDRNSTPPQKPNDDNDQMENTDNTTQNSNSENQIDMSQNTKPESMPSMEPNKNTNIDTIYYVLFGAESLAISLLFVYFVMSNFNKKSLKETFKSGDKILIFALALSFLTTVITYSDKVITEKYFMQNQMQMGDNNFADSESSNVETNGALEVADEQTLSDNNYSSSNSDESAILVKDSGSLTLSNANITKSGDSTNTENSEFYGVNAGVLVTKNSTATITDSNISTEAKGANAVFATGENSKIYISNSTINTTGSSSARGLDATYGGYIEADKVNITTQGGSCATLATDRGEGTVIAKNSKLETNGKGSPVIYSTGDISIENTEGVANSSQMVVIEGKNSATVKNSNLEASATGNRGDVDVAGIMIYQSMSGDASEGTGTFTSDNSTLKIQSNSSYYKTAPMFFVTNTDAVINLTNTNLVYGSNVLLSAKSTSEWGNTSSNGGNVTLNASKQTLKGNIEIDNISTLTLNLENSTYEGTINADNTAKNITLSLDKNSKITLTGDSYVTSFTDADTSYSNIDFNGYKLYVNGKAIN